MIEGQTVLLFDDIKAYRDFDYEKCKNIGSDKSVFERLRSLKGKFISLSATNIGDPYEALSDDTFAFNSVNGRSIQQWCVDRDIYWIHSYRDGHVKVIRSRER